MKRFISNKMKIKNFSYTACRSFLVFVITFLTIQTRGFSSNQKDGYEQILRSFSEFYHKNHVALQVKINEADPSISASADFDGTTYSITVNRALLNSNRITADGLRIILCHEAGHLFGGAPRKSAPPEWDGSLAPDGRSWMSAEAQSDYYAGAVCFRKFVRFENSQFEPITLDEKNEFEFAYANCLAVWKNSADARLCARASVGASNFLKLTWDFNISLQTPSVERPDSSIIETYPSRQCRLDTVFNGARCRSELPLIWNLNDSAINDCPDENFARNRCWYVE